MADAQAHDDVHIRMLGIEHLSLEDGIAGVDADGIAFFVNSQLYLGNGAGLAGHTENFEAVDAAMNGGYDYTDRYGNTMKSLEGMARWQPSNGFRKGGVGTYHMEAEYGTTPEYKNLRKAIQIMNPSSHSLVKY